MAAFAVIGWLALVGLTAWITVGAGYFAYWGSALSGKTSPLMVLLSLAGATGLITVLLHAPFHISMTVG